MKIKYIIIFIVAVIIGAIIDDQLSRPKHQIDPVIIRDTVVVERIVRDTIILQKTRIVASIDTVMVQLPGCTTKVAVMLDFEEKTYIGDNYNAVVFGYKPELRQIDVKVRERTITETITKYEVKPPRIQAGIIAGAMIGRHYNTEYIGARLRYNWGALNAEGVLAFDPFNNKPYLEVRAGIDLFK